MSCASARCRGDLIFYILNCKGARCRCDLPFYSINCAGAKCCCDLPFYSMNWAGARCRGDLPFKSWAAQVRDAAVIFPLNHELCRCEMPRWSNLLYLELHRCEMPRWSPLLSSWSSGLSFRREWSSLLSQQVDNEFFYRDYVFII